MNKIDIICGRSTRINKEKLNNQSKKKQIQKTPYKELFLPIVNRSAQEIVPLPLTITYAKFRENDSRKMKNPKKKIL